MTLYHGTDIDGVFIDPDRLEVRGVDLCQIIHGLGYTDSIAHILAGDGHGGWPGCDLDGAFSAALRDLRPATPAVRLTLAAREAGANRIQAVTAGLMAAPTVKPDADVPGALGLDPEAGEALAVVAMLPGLVAVAEAGAENVGSVLARAGEGDDVPYMVRLHRLFTAAPGPGATAMVERVLTAWHGGFGYLPPSVMMPRIAIGTGVSYRQGFGAGFAAGGPMHIGATENAMRLLIAVLAASRESGDVRAAARGAVQRVLGDHGRLPGFGHPLFKCDPRPQALLTAIAGSTDCLELTAYHAIADAALEESGVLPNIDAATAALFLAAGITDPETGAALSLCARAAGMLAHMIERKRKPAFGVTSAVARRHLDGLPKDWL